MTLAQATALRQLPHFAVVAHVASSAESRDLIVRGACGLYWLSPGGLLTPIQMGRRAA